jgi:hypothetical protein
MAKQKIWTGRDASDRLYVITVENVLPEDDVPFAVAEGISVSLKFMNASGMTKIVERGFWLYETDREIELEGGVERAFILGEMSDGTWTCYDNKFSMALTYEQVIIQEWFPDERRADDPEEVTIPFMDGGYITVEVKLISKTLRRVICKGEYRIKALNPQRATVEKVL